MNDILIYTERLKIWDHVHKHLQDLHSLLSDEQIMYYLPELKTETLQQSANNLIDAMNQRHVQNRTKCFLRIELADTFEYVGEIGYYIVRNEKEGPVANIGWFLKKDMQKKGYCTEAALALIDYAFNQGGIYRIESGCLTENAASERVMQKCNMIKDDSKTHYVMHDGKEKQRVEYYIVNPAFQ